MKFETLVSKIQAQFTKMSATQLFTTELKGEDLWNIYFNSFENHPIWRVKSEHDCNADRQFIERYGNIVSLDENLNIVTMFDIDGNLGEYQNSINNLSSKLKQSRIESLFVTNIETLAAQEGVHKHGEKYQLGQISKNVIYTNKKLHWLTNELMESDKSYGRLTNHVYTFTFFHVFIPKQYVLNSSVGTYLNDKNTTQALFAKGLNIPLETLELVRDLFIQGSLLKADMYLDKVNKFIELKKEFDKVNNVNWIWNKFQSISFARFANEVVGNLCIELAEGKDINVAALAFNKMVDSANYMIAKAAITPKQFAEAEKSIIDLGYADSFERRFANIDDIDVSYIKHTNTDNAVKKPLGLFGKAGIKTTTSFNRHKRAEFDNVAEVSIDKFMKEILPSVTSMEVLLENKHDKNLVAMLVAKDKTAKNILAWNNPFNFTYNGNLSGVSQIKQAVKSRGGNTDADVRISLFFPNTTDDYDLHVIEPNGNEIYYRNLRKRQPSSGMLDLDAQGVDGLQIPEKRVENVTYIDKSKMPIGDYVVNIHNFSQNGFHTKFQLEVEINNEITLLELKETTESNKIKSVVINWNGSEFSLNVNNTMSIISSDTITQKLWNLDTNQFHKVILVCESPNHWGDNAFRTKDYFFMLQDCKTNDKLKSFHADQLNNELLIYRKQLNTLGDYKPVEPTDKQLCGLGFNCNIQNELIVRVKGTFNRTLKIKF